MADAVFSASFLNACLRNADVVTMANIAPTVNARGPIFVHKNGLVKRTTFHVLRMYHEALRANVVAAAVNSTKLEHGGKSVAAVDAIVTADESGSTAIVTNRHPSETARCLLKLDGIPFSGTIEAEILEGDSPDSYNSIENPEAVLPRRATLSAADGYVEIPPHSVCVLRW
jgi:alpha-N-arabinofuranosidase